MFDLSPDIERKLIGTLLVFVGLLVLRWLLLRIVHRYVEEPEVWYRSRKGITYAVSVVGIFTLSYIWVDAFNDLPTFLGLVSAGIAIALADLLKNMAGWLYILVRRPFKVGDRVAVGDVAGDVVDVRLFRFTVMEIGKWVDAEQSTGRLVHVPNGLVFTNSVANYTEGFPYIWHEIPVLITFESDWKLAERRLLEVVERHAGETASRAARQMRDAASRYSLKIGTLTPKVYLTTRDSGVLLTARFVTDARERRGMEELIWRDLLDVIAEEPAFDLAYPTARTYFQGPIEVKVEGPNAEG